MPENNCIFCRIFNFELPSRVLYKDENTIAILDNTPRLAKGQCVVFHKRHVNQFYELDDKEIAELFITVKKVARRLKLIFNPEYVCVFSRGQTVPHSHIIIFPSSPLGTLDGVLHTIETTRILTLETCTEESLDNIAKDLKIDN